VPVLKAGDELEEEPTAALIKQSRFNGYVGLLACVNRLTLFVPELILTTCVGRGRKATNIFLPYVWKI
jgi:hypothetical protein